MSLKKTTRKKNAAVGEITATVSGPEVFTTDYWRSRSLDDPDRDWSYHGDDWVQDYVISKEHEHRDMLLDALRFFYPFQSLLEVGCNAGPNLLRIEEEYPEAHLFGIDVNAPALHEAKLLLPKAILKVGDVRSIPVPSSSVDIVISDAVLLYIPPQDINRVMDEICRVSRKAVILVERYAASELGKVVGHVWGRDYEKLLENRGFLVDERPIPWGTSENWKRYGRLYVAKR